MTSSAEEKRERAIRRSRFIGRVRRELKQAIADAKKRGISQAQIARKIGRQPAVITRQLSGEANLTLSSIGDLAWALDLFPRFALFTAEQLTGEKSNSVALHTRARVINYTETLKHSPAKTEGTPFVRIATEAE